MDDKIFLQIIDFNGLCGFVSKCNYADTITTYQLPDKASKYAGEPGKLMDLLISYYKDDEEIWRVDKKRTVALELQDECCLIGEKGADKPRRKKLVDADKVFAIASLNSFFVIPGKESIANGSFNPSEVIQLSNLIAVKPLMLILGNEVVDKEKDVWKLTASFKGN